MKTRIVIAACALLFLCQWSFARRNPQGDTSLADYIARAQRALTGTANAGSVGSIWSPGGAFTDLAADYKARKAGDLIVINIVEETLAEASGAVTAQRKFETSSGITALAGRINTRGIDRLLSADSSSQLQGKGETASKSRLRTSVAGQVVAVLPNGNIVVEARREVLMNNEKQTVLLRGIARPGDIGPENAVLSTELGDLEIELRGKGVISEATRRPNLLFRALMWLVSL